VVTHPQRSSGSRRETGRRHFPQPPLTVEVKGPYACFTRPELKTERVSYPVMTPSAAKGVLEAIYWKPEFDYVVTAIEVLNPIQWVAVRRNEVTSMITLDWVRRAMSDPALRYDVETDRDQRNTVFLNDVWYRIRAQVRLRPHADKPEAAYRDQLRRRVDRGACFSEPFLGTRECSAESFGKETGQPPIERSEDLGVMLHGINYSQSGETYTWFPARLDNGIMAVPEQGIELAHAATQPGRGA
jgi:CRISPR-associated protein Cas5d